ncbi:hypothetical protein NC653_034514 [Populus alba x Populus x berolinensis]|uniref:Uncharacterized protein n=1 Tax=Populus alba x Populus x berolinensis TaxID=444605 RepID=A0AAD6LMR4_9ROSI|nr:hypothetical protein NC653_034514 [Populus alba x Populus x berolinensis]
MALERELMLRRKQTGSMSLIFSPLSDLAFSQQIPTSVMGNLCLGHLDGCLFSSATSQQERDSRSETACRFEGEGRVTKTDNT